jgi:fatty acid synthase subunit alpha, fungi type
MGRQDAVLLSATTIQPGSRVVSKQDSETFIDSAVEKYARDVDLVLTAVSHQVPQESTSRNALLPQKLKNEARVKSSLSAVSTQKPGAPAETDASAERIEYLEKKIRACQDVIDQWNVEHGDFYTTGIAPLFQASQIRLYDSYWNWARQDLLRALHAIERGGMSVDELGTLFRSLRNKADIHLLQILEHFKNKTRQDIQTAHILEDLDDVVAAFKQSILLPPTVARPSITKPRTSIDLYGKISFTEIPRNDESQIDQPGRTLTETRSTPSNHYKLKAGAGQSESNFGEANDPMHHIKDCFPEDVLVLNGSRLKVAGYKNLVGDTDNNSSTLTGQLDMTETAVSYPRTEPELIEGKDGCEQISSDWARTKRFGDIESSKAFWAEDFKRSKTVSTITNLNTASGSIDTDSTSEDAESSASKSSTTDRRQDSNITKDEDPADKGLNSPKARIRQLNGYRIPIKGHEVDTSRLRTGIHIMGKRSAFWRCHAELTTKYLGILQNQQGLELPKQFQVLLTGAGENSIGEEVLKGLLSGGAQVVMSTSSYSSSTMRRYQNIYRSCGAKGSCLVVAPFNQGSRQDVEALVAHIYNAEKGLGWDLDCMIPLAAISENGRDIDDIDSRSELSHRIMLTNCLRLLGAVKRQKFSRGILTHPAQVILPLSPNHGTFGFDGLYAESKLSLEALFEKWHSEDWSGYLSICGATIGWTRSTGLMSTNDAIAEGIERLGVRTFSRQEMAFNILALMCTAVREVCEVEPLCVNLDGGMGSIPNLKEAVDQLRKGLDERSMLQRAIFQDSLRDEAVTHSKDLNSPSITTANVEKRSNIKIAGPRIPNIEVEISPLHERLQGMVDIDNVVVISGYSELGPLGNARTRWQMEADGEFSVEGCIEIAWIMGLIKYENRSEQDRGYCGWVDARTKTPIADVEFKPKYEKYILEHTGIRLNESAGDDSASAILHEITIQEDLAPFEADLETAKAFKRMHGKYARVTPIPGSAEVNVFLRKGAVLKVPKSSGKSRRVEGQLPTGWNARTYGISEDIISQVDLTTLYLLSCTGEAFLSAGIRDPFEFYRYIHVSEFANCIGTGSGPHQASKLMYHGRYMNESIQNDILQETFCNTPAAWINLLLLSSSGPIKTPVGACATSLESLESGYETIVSGKAKACLVGGFEDLHEDISSEFRNMNATIDAELEFANGRDPTEMSRPTTTSRNGFVEAAGCGVQIITTARLALDMGLPIYGVVALAELASDQIGRSIPAPGKGIMTVVREVPGPFPYARLDIKKRRRTLELRKSQIQQHRLADLEYLEEELMSMQNSCETYDPEGYLQERRREIELEAQRQHKQALNACGNQFWKSDPRISPLRGALSVWGLTVDDLGVASLHGTSTKKNDINEASVLHEQLNRMGRSTGNPIPTVLQKYLTGHSKGAAGAWMLNGCLQMLDSGYIPGNRNADNIDKELQRFDNLAYLDTGLQTAGIKAFSITSFGFGQKGAQAIGVHPKYLYASLEREVFGAYKKKTEKRMRQADTAFQRAMMENSVFVAKEKAPYRPEDAIQVLTNPSLRASMNAQGEYVVTV